MKFEKEKYGSKTIGINTIIFNRILFSVNSKLTCSLIKKESIIYTDVG